MNIVKLSEHVAVSAQIAAEDVAGIAAAGYAVLINNRPDGEEGGQPDDAEIATAAKAAGLEYHYMPITAMNFPGPDFDAMSDLFDDPERPVLAFCRTGTRCTNLWVSVQEASVIEAAAATAGQLGFDLGMASRFLANPRGN